MISYSLLFVVDHTVAVSLASNVSSLPPVLCVTDHPLMPSLSTLSTINTIKIKGSLLKQIKVYKYMYMYAFIAFMYKFTTLFLKSSTNTVCV